MDQETPALGFEIKYADKLFFCEALVHSDTIKVFFNNYYMADVEYNPASGWIQTNGTLLPQSIIEEIGAHIDGQLD
ncbi:MAG TPA: hypothetical protein VGN20_01050 [Mucilaginibacter sp.]|jgi:hypothetical protein